MTIMVDEVQIWPGARPPFHLGSCHLTTTNTGLDDLHAFAALLGLKRDWFQPRPRPHYDLTRAKRLAALRLGAVYIPATRQAAYRMGLIKLETLLGPELARIPLQSTIRLRSAR